MLLYLIRHGEPDYQTDTLTETGWLQARKLAKRLAVSGLDEIHASPMGRAQQTAQPTAELLNLPIITEPWAKELGEETYTTYPDGVPKAISRLMPEYYHQKKFVDMNTETAFAKIPGLCDSGFHARYKSIADGLDAMLAKTGYVRNDNGFYDVVKPDDRHIALFCHAAMMRVLLSHLMHIPVQLLSSSAMLHFTGITILYFDPSKFRKDQTTELCPGLISYGDVGHLFAEGEENIHFWTGKTF